MWLVLLGLMAAAGEETTFTECVFQIENSEVSELVDLRLRVDRDAWWPTDEDSHDETVEKTSDPLSLCLETLESTDLGYDYYADDISLIRDFTWQAQEEKELVEDILEFAPFSLTSGYSYYGSYDRYEQIFPDGQRLRVEIRSYPEWEWRRGYR
jgi:hypothetical protein